VVVVVADLLVLNFLERNLELVLLVQVALE
jgi:hypothetical protein